MSPLLHSARFFITAADLAGLPRTGLPEVAFVGRSNAGKSTCINALTQHRQLAFASKTPGRTQQINFFAVGLKGQDTGYLVDLPGYGYAAVSRQEKQRWQAFIGEYLHSRAPLQGLILITDSRIGLTPLDLALLDLMREQPHPVHVLVAKSDKLSQREKQAALRAAEQALGDYLADHASAFELSVQLFSATRHEGLHDLTHLIEGWLGAA